MFDIIVLSAFLNLTVSNTKIEQITLHVPM